MQSSITFETILIQFLNIIEEKCHPLPSSRITLTVGPHLISRSRLPIGTLSQKCFKFRTPDSIGYYSYLFSTGSDHLETESQSPEVHGSLYACISCISGAQVLQPNVYHQNNELCL